jgi:DNA-binding XRE family transcriptional regulator
MVHLVQRNLGHRIAEARCEAGLTQVQLAEAVDHAQRTVASWEGGTRVPRLPALEAVSETTGKPVSWFYELETAA